MTADTAPTWLPSWDGAAYAANTGHHRAHDAAFLGPAPIRPTDRLLDLGSGAGDLTADIATLVPDGEVVGVDPQPSMLAEARRRARPNQSFVEGTAQRLLEAVPAGSFDGILSRAALQWVPIDDHPGVLAGVHDALRPGGWFRLDMGGHGNVPVLVALMDDVAVPLGGRRPPWAFPDAATYMDLLERAGFEHRNGFVRTAAQRRPFDAETIVGWLHTQGYTGYLPELPPSAHEAFRAGVESRLDELRRHDGSFDQTFVRLDALVFRPA